MRKFKKESQSNFINLQRAYKKTQYFKLYTVTNLINIKLSDPSRIKKWLKLYDGNVLYNKFDVEYTCRHLTVSHLLTLRRRFKFLEETLINTSWISGRCIGNNASETRNWMMTSWCKTLIGWMITAAWLAQRRLIG